MMKYTEQEFKFDHIFDLIRYVSSSLFLAPIRFTNEITRKLSYLPKKSLIQVSQWALGINGLLLVFYFIVNIRKRIFNPLVGRIPILVYALSLGFSFLLYYKVRSWVEPEFRKATKDKKEFIQRPDIVQDVHLEDEDIIGDDSLEELELETPEIFEDAPIASQVELENFSEEEINNLNDEQLGVLLDRKFTIDGDKLQKECREAGFGAVEGYSYDEIDELMNNAVSTNKYNLSEEPFTFDEEITLESLDDIDTSLITPDMSQIDTTLNIHDVPTMDTDFLMSNS